MGGFFLNLIIAAPSAYSGRFAGCCYSIVLCLVVYIAGFYHVSGAAEAPFLSVWGVVFTARNVWDADQKLRTWIGRSVQVASWIGLLSWQIWGGLAFPPSISCQILLSSCLPPISYFFSPYVYDTRPKGVLRIASLVCRGIPASQSLVPSRV